MNLWYNHNIFTTITIVKVYLNEVPLKDGFELLGKHKRERLVGGRCVSKPSGKELFVHLVSTGQAISCWACGCTADRWVVDRHKNDLLCPPTLNLYALKEKSAKVKRKKIVFKELVMMTRDHIIPRSLNGVDDVQNLRAACEDCNRQRGNAMDDADKQFMLDHPHLIRSRT